MGSQSISSKMSLRPLALGSLMVTIAAVLVRGAPKTACPHWDGFQVYADKQMTVVSGRGSRMEYGSMEAARTQCETAAAGGGCLSYDNLGAVYQGTSAGLVDALGVCTYVYGDCPSYAGFTAYNSTGVAVSGAIHSSSDRAQAFVACSNDPTCKGFTYNVITSAAGYFSGGAITAYSFQQSNCVFIKNSALPSACPRKYGWTSMLGKQVAGVSDATFAAASGSLSGGATAAEQHCRVNPRCTAWDSSGKVAFGGVGGYVDAGNSCTYVKDPCPPQAGFTAYDGLTDASAAPSSRRTDLCAADLYTTCLNDPTCKGFDTLRRMWTAQLNPTATYGGMCTYVRATGY